MTITIETIYEQGFLKLLQPIPLAEGTRVELSKFGKFSLTANLSSFGGKSPEEKR